VNRGSLNAAALVEVLLDVMATSQEVGACRVLRRYERWRRDENLLMLEGGSREVEPIVGSGWRCMMGFAKGSTHPTLHWFSVRRVGAWRTIPRYGENL
jgi:2-polyprenyl-6-methoxyphenol hydroxylase-like FAD-dependent oxidoreductase